MARIPDLDVDVYPPFEGFPPEGIRFLRSLKRNNRREWFERHRDEYESLVRAPMLSLIAALQPHFAQFAPEFDLNPKRAVFRIYRDIRFSTDKTPYKTHIAAHFVLRGKPKGIAGSGYYLQIEPGEVFIGGGIYIPDSDQLKKIRRAIAGRGDAFTAIVTAPTFKRMFGRLEGERLKRIPAGFDETHPMAEWLKFKQFFAGASWPDRVCQSPACVTRLARACETLAPLVRFLNDAIGV